MDAQNGSEKLWSDSEGAINFLIFAEMRKCPHRCKKVFDEGVFIPTGRAYPNNVLISGEWAFHWSDSHGVPREMFTDLLTDYLYLP